MEFSVNRWRLIAKLVRGISINYASDSNVKLWWVITTAENSRVSLKGITSMADASS